MLQSDLRSNGTPAIYNVYDLDKLLSPLALQFPHLSNGNDDIYSLGCYEN